MDELQQCSLVISKILDRMGYCRFIRDARKVKYNKMIDALDQLAVADGQWILAGSKAEGLSHAYQSDIDAILICNCCEAREAFEDIAILDETRYYFKPLRGFTPAGYCMLELIKKPSPEHQFGFIEDCLENLGGYIEYLRSALFQKFYVRTRTMTVDQGVTAMPYAGPSRAYEALSGNFGFGFKIDSVDSIPLPWSADLDTWSKRPRLHDWPSESLRQDILATPANLTPVGSKEGEYGNREWRFCFNVVENKLINSLNDTQLKLFATLKMILKDRLKPEKKEVTSYVMKNIVLWMCESKPIKSFTPDSLLHRIHECLETLKLHIQEGNLPYYLIPERNLLHGKFVGDESKSELLGKLDELLASGPDVVRVCTMIQVGLDLCNKKLLQAWGLGRDILETWFLNTEFDISKIVQGKLQILHANDLDCAVLDVMMPDLDILIGKGLFRSELIELLRKRVCVFLNVQEAEELAKNITFSKEPILSLVERLEQNYELRMKKLKKNTGESSFNNEAILSSKDLDAIANKLSETFSDQMHSVVHSMMSEMQRSLEESFLCKLASLEKGNYELHKRIKLLSRKPDDHISYKLTEVEREKTLESDMDRANQYSRRNSL